MAGKLSAAIVSYETHSFHTKLYIPYVKAMCEQPHRKATAARCVTWDFDPVQFRKASPDSIDSGMTIGYDCSAAMEENRVCKVRPACLSLCYISTLCACHSTLAAKARNPISRKRGLGALLRDGPPRQHPVSPALRWSSRRNVEQEGSLPSFWAWNPQCSD